MEGGPEPEEPNSDGWPLAGKLRGDESVRFDEADLSTPGITVGVADSRVLPLLGAACGSSKEEGVFAC